MADNDAFSFLENKFRHILTKIFGRFNLITLLSKLRYRLIEIFNRLLEEHRVQRAQWSLASMFADPGTDVPDLPQIEPLQRLRRAVLAFRAAPKQDLRRACLALLPAGIEAPAPADLQQANRFLSSITPIWGSEPLPVPLALDLRGEEAYDIRQIAALLSTAYLIGRDVAENLVEKLGGEAALFAQFRAQTPWVTAPEIEEAGRHGRTVRANWYYAAEPYQPDPHETVCGICDTLIALSPASDAAACDAVDPMGRLSSSPAVSRRGPRTCGGTTSRRMPGSPGMSRSVR